MRVLRGDSLADFIEWVRLRTDLDTVAEDGHAVTMMTVHSSKGLEFDCVFVAGMEETLFPHMNSVGDAVGIEEERRLAYVAITRARKKLFLTCAYARQIFGQTSSNPISRFIQEIPSELRQTTGLGSAGFSGTGWEKRGSRKGIAGSGTEAGGGRVFGRSSASGSSGRSDERAARVGGSYVRPGAEKKAAAKMTFSTGDTVDHKIRPRQGDEGGRRHAVREVLQNRSNEEASQRLRAHRQDRLARGPHRKRCGLVVSRRFGFFFRPGSCNAVRYTA